MRIHLIKTIESKSNLFSISQVIIVFDIYDYTPITGPSYPVWSEAMGWMLVVFVMMWVPIWYLTKLGIAYWNRNPVTDTFWTVSWFCFLLFLSFRAMKRGLEDGNIFLSKVR